MTIDALEECKEMLDIDANVVASLDSFCPVIHQLSDEGSFTLVKGTFDAVLAAMVVKLGETELSEIDLSGMRFEIKIEHRDKILKIDGSPWYRLILPTPKKSKKNIARVIKYWSIVAAKNYLKKMGKNCTHQRIAKISRRISNVLNKLLLDKRLTSEILEEAKSVELIKIS